MSLFFFYIYFGLKEKNWKFKIACKTGALWAKREATLGYPDKLHFYIDSGKTRDLDLKLHEASQKLNWHLPWAYFSLVLFQFSYLILAKEWKMKWKIIGLNFMLVLTFRQFITESISDTKVTGAPNNNVVLNSWFATTWQGDHVGGQNKRIFPRRIYMKIEFRSQRREMLLFLTTNMAAVTSRANQQYTENTF